MIDPGEMIGIPLTDEERALLRCGLGEWNGPASCTDAMAVAMGFDSVHDLFSESDRLRSELDAQLPLSRWDWSRTLLATEIVFASDVMGSGIDWESTTGFDDQRSLEVLRILQRKLGGALMMIGPRGGGSTP